MSKPLLVDCQHGDTAAAAADGGKTLSRAHNASWRRLWQAIMQSDVGTEMRCGHRPFTCVTIHAIELKVLELDHLHTIL